MKRRFLLSLACGGAVAHAATSATTHAVLTTPASSPAILWGACPSTVVYGDWPELGGRLRCARLSMPLDHSHADGRSIDVGVARISAALPGEREGTIFVNNGGPGAQSAAFIASMMSAFSHIEYSDPLHGLKRLLSDRFDIVAVIPRGLPGGWSFDCVSEVMGTHLPLDTHRDDANWAKAVADARQLAASCSRPVESAYISTWQHVHDMEAVRIALGEKRIHFYGASYGGKVGTWYASLFPQQLGRLLLDSSMYVPGRFIDAIYLSNDARKTSPRAHHARSDDDVDADPFSASVYHATLCNDDYWDKRETHIRARNDRDAYQYPHAGGHLAILQLTCAAWPYPDAPQPDLEPMRSKPFLLLQSAQEVVTPLPGARAMARQYPNARLVVVKGSDIHGLLSDTATPCIEHDAVRYLLDGTLPYDSPGEYTCELVPLPGDDDSGPSYEIDR
jgi:pimeloyl-ACP methyl ester carboxylesterase